MLTMTRTISRPLAGFAAAAAIIVALAGCTSAPTEATTSTAATPPASGSKGAQVSEADFSAARDVYDLKLAKCIRGKGFEIKDPKPGEGIQESSPEINEAGLACMHEIGDPPRIAGGVKRDKAAVARELKEVKCFRALGFDVEEPTLDLSYTVPGDATQEQMAQCISASGR